MGCKCQQSQNIRTSRTEKMKLFRLEDSSAERERFRTNGD